MSITEIAIKRPSLVIVLFLALGVLGGFGYTQLPYELLPKISVPVVTVTTIYSGASPSEVEDSVTRPIEEAVSGVDKVDQVKATSFEGQSVVQISFNSSANVDLAMQDVQRKVNGVILDLPKDVRTPIVQKFSIDEAPVITAAVTSNLPPREFYQFLKDQIQPALATLSGVGQITLTGGSGRAIRVNLDPAKLRFYQLSISGITARINASNVDFPTGTVEGERSESVVRVAGRFASLADLRRLVVARRAGGGEVRLEEVASVEDGDEERRTYSRIDGQDSVSVSIIKQADANSVSVAALVRDRFASLERDYRAEGLNFRVASDQSTYTIEAADG